MDGLRSELTLLTKRAEMLQSEETSFKFELAEVSKFFKTAGSYRKSDLFPCGDLQWYLWAECKKKGTSKSLDLYLGCENPDLIEWSCKVDFKLILFSKLPGNKTNYVRKTSNVFVDKIGHGFLSFVSYSELTDKSKGYIVDDNITLGVEMRITRSGARSDTSVVEQDV